MQALAAFRRWLFRLQGPEPSPIVLVQRRVYVLPTRAGLAFAAALLLMLVGAINYNLSLGHALIFLLAGLALVTLLHTFRNLAGLEIRAGRSEPVHAGELARFELRLSNPSRFARLALELAFESGPAQPIDLPAEATTPVKLAVPAPRRGWLRPGRLTLETRFPLCLVRAWSYVEPDMRCLVYPQAEHQPPPLPRSGHGRASAAAARSGQGHEDFSGLRAHQPADSPRHIAWKAVAHEQPLLTKVFAGAQAEDLWLDWDALPRQLDVEARLSRLTAWLLQAAAQGQACGLRLPGRTIAPGAGPRFTQEALEALALHGQ